MTTNAAKPAPLNLEAIAVCARAYSEQPRGDVLDLIEELRAARFKLSHGEKVADLLRRSLALRSRAEVRSSPLISSGRPEGTTLLREADGVHACALSTVEAEHPEERLGHLAEALISLWRAAKSLADSDYGDEPGDLFMAAEAMKLATAAAEAEVDLRIYACVAFDERDVSHDP